MIVFILLILTTLGASIQPTNGEDLRKEIANPTAAIQLLSFDFASHQNSGPYNRSEDVLDTHPRYFTKGENWNLVHHFDIPLVLKPDDVDNNDHFGLGNAAYRMYVSPSKYKDWAWGMGPAIRASTGATEIFNNNSTAAGIAVSVVYQPVIFSMGGELVQLWSDRVNETRVHPIVETHLGAKTTLGFLDTITVDWRAPEGQRFTVPMGMEIRQLFRSELDTPVSVSFGVFGDTTRPDNTSDWHWRLRLNIVNSK
ncbi:hypothetical protein [Bdellovibrio sp. HCB274]|uniref:hypothetical protein n=1 Tax=Bdellovibrio sp. HCB274 TaxID=3394361 RepID=UPI0039B62C7E